MFAFYTCHSFYCNLFFGGKNKFIRETVIKRSHTPILASSYTFILVSSHIFILISNYISILAIFWALTSILVFTISFID